MHRVLLVLVVHRALNVVVDLQAGQRLFARLDIILRRDRLIVRAEHDVADLRLGTHIAEQASVVFRSLEADVCDHIATTVISSDKGVLKGLPDGFLPAQDRLRNVVA